uniref:ANM5 n=1 Tax=Arundo donax TaxID=35708 RepID=A0A0A9GQ59_ARUDO
MILTTYRQTQYDRPLLLWIDDGVGVITDHSYHTFVGAQQRQKCTSRRPCRHVGLPQREEDREPAKHVWCSGVWLNSETDILIQNRVKISSKSVHKA